MTLTYIFHSGFVLEAERCILVFDYWMDPARVMSRVLASKKPIYVFSSHFHEDHFTRKILDWRKSHENITYVLSKDIMKRRRASLEDGDVSCRWPHRQWIYAWRASVYRAFLCQTVRAYALRSQRV